MSLFLVVAHMLHNADRQMWIDYFLCREWWPNAITIFEVSPPIQGN